MSTVTNHNNFCMTIISAESTLLVVWHDGLRRAKCVWRCWFEIYWIREHGMLCLEREACPKFFRGRSRSRTTKSDSKVCKERFFHKVGQTYFCECQCLVSQASTWGHNRQFSLSLNIDEHCWFIFSLSRSTPRKKKEFRSHELGGIPNKPQIGRVPCVFFSSEDMSVNGSIPNDYKRM